MKKKQASPGTIAAMIGGIVLAIGFAVYQVTSAMGPSAPAAPANPPANNTAAAPAPNGGTAGPAQAANPAAPAPAGKTDVAQGSNTDATLNPEADPFKALPTIATPAQNNAAPIQRAVTNAANNTAYRVPDNNRGNLPQMGTVKPLPVIGNPNSGPVVTLAPEPELAGTLLGDRPSAVFREGQSLAVVPKGAALHGWKVVDVQHGSALVKNNGVQVRLVVGGMQPTSGVGTIRRGDNAGRAPSVATATEPAAGHDVQTVEAPPALPATTVPDQVSSPTALSEGGRIQGEVSDPSAQPLAEQTPVAEKDPFAPAVTPVHRAPIKLSRAYTPTVEDNSQDAPLHRLIVAARQSHPDSKPASGTTIEAKQKAAPAPKIRRKHRRIARRSLRRHKVQIARASVRHHRHKRHRRGHRHHASAVAHHAHQSHVTVHESTSSASETHSLRTVGF